MKNKALCFALSLLVVGLGLTSCKKDVDVVGTSHDKVADQNLPGIYSAMEQNGTTLTDYEYQLNADGTGKYIVFETVGGEKKAQSETAFTYTKGDYQALNYGMVIHLTINGAVKDVVWKDGSIYVDDHKAEKVVATNVDYMTTLTTDVPGTTWMHEDYTYFTEQYKDTTVTSHQESDVKQHVDEATYNEYKAKYGNDPSWKEKKWDDGTYTFQYSVTILDTTITQKTDTLGPKTYYKYTIKFDNGGVGSSRKDSTIYKLAVNAAHRGHTYLDRTEVDKQGYVMQDFKWGFYSITNARIFYLNLVTTNPDCAKQIRLSNYQKAKGVCSIDDVSYTLVK